MIKGITCDSRRIKSGYIFVCLKGENDSGYRYAEQAYARGACAILADSAINSEIPVILCKNPRLKMAEYAKKIYSAPDEKMIMTGVTGTNGKTTVTHLIRDILVFNGHNTALIGTNGCFYNQHLTDESFTTSTTPESAELYKILYNMHELGADSAVMEVSSHALELDRVHKMKYDIAAFTNLTQDHMDFHKNMENYYKAKEKLFESAKKCVINTDDKYGKRLYEKYREKSVSYGFCNADIMAENIEYTPYGSKFILSDKGESSEFYINIPGKFSVYNAMCAYAVCREYGIEKEAIANTLAKTAGVKGRAERVDVNTDYNIIIDYAHSPDSLENIIKSVKCFTSGKIITVFGCGGNRDREKRAVMGEISAKLSDFTVITSDNPRFENPVQILRDIEKGIYKVTNNYAVIPDRYEAIKYAMELASPKDSVLLCGKGHEDYIIKNDKKIPFDEREIVKNIIENNLQ